MPPGERMIIEVSSEEVPEASRLKGARGQQNRGLQVILG
jgi:hypothetical protein